MILDQFKLAFFEKKHIFHLKDLKTIKIGGFKAFFMQTKKNTTFFTFLAFPLKKLAF